MTPRSRILGAVAGALGLAAAGAAIGIRRQSRAIGRREGDETPFGSLHSPPMTIIADDGEPTAQDWAEACGTISYEIVTRIGGRFTRRYVDSEAHGTIEA